MGLFAPPVRDYDGRKNLRSLADALHKLHQFDNLSDREIVEVKTLGFDFGYGHRTAVVSVVRPRRPDGSMFVVLMPASNAFSAITTLGNTVSYPIDVLEGARSDVDGNVTLKDGRFVHGVTLMPAPFPNFSETDQRILRLALRFLEVEERCLRPLDPRDPDLLPGLKVFDYSLLGEVQIHHLKAVQHYVLKHLPKVPSSAVTSALKRAGLRLPRSTPYETSSQ